MNKSMQMKLYLSLLIFIFSSSCSKHMSIDKAKLITASFSGQRFTPPPRRIDDITKILDRVDAAPEKFKNYREVAGSEIPDTIKDKKKAVLYFKRAEAKFILGIPCLDDYRKAFDLVKTKQGFLTTKKGFNITWKLGKREFALGNAKNGLELMELAKKNFPKTDATGLVGRYSAIGDFEAAENARRQTIKSIDKKKQGRRKKINERPKQIMNKCIVTAEMLEFKGKYKKAEPYRRKALEVSYQLTYDNIFFPIYRRTDLTQNLMKQKRFPEAEVEVRKTLKEGLSIMEKPHLSKVIIILSMILAKEDRLNEAEQLLRKLLQIEENAGYPENSSTLAKIHFKLGQILVAQSKWNESLNYFRKARRVLKGDLKYAKFFLNNEDFGLSLLKTGHIKESIEVLNEAYQFNKKIHGKKAKKTKRILSFIGLANAEAGNDSAALKIFGKSIRGLIKSVDDEETDKIKILKRRILFTGYIDLLARISGTKLEKKFKINALAEAFKIADFSRSQSVQAALAKSGARASLGDPELADYSRREQDARMQLHALKAVLSNHYALPENQQKKSVISSLTKEIKLLDDAQRSLNIEIKNKFPDYAELFRPKSADIGLIQQKLLAGETLISYFVTENKTYIWAVPKKGPFAFAVAQYGREEIKRIVDKLRESLDIHIRTFGDIPDFDTGAAHALYKSLLEPVSTAFKNSKELIIAGHEALSQLPFSMLVTKPVSIEKDPDELFSKYKKIPWLIHKFSVTNIPSVSSFISLRSSKVGKVQKRAFAGFGDPVFSREQAEVLHPSGGKSSTGYEIKKFSLNSRGLRIVKDIPIDTSNSNSLKLEMLQRLPDTSDEVLTIAKILGAEPTKDVFLQKKANETIVKSIDLSDRKVILFSTHALVAGDLDGLTQPAIALSSPTVTGNNQDGLLTMDEIMGLRLNADWVVLSACNTAAASGKGAAAVSGLGRAFFYAGTKALLVSNWSVETTSAKALVTDLFRAWKKNKGTRSGALRLAELKLIKSEGLIDANTGKRVLSYSHPFFWAPFTLVGDGAN